MTDDERELLKEIARQCANTQLLLERFASGEHTGRHELIGGVIVEVPDSTKRRAVNTMAIVKYLVGAILAGGGWVMHAIHAWGGK